MKNLKVTAILLSCVLFFMACVGSPNEQAGNGGGSGRQTNKDPNRKLKIGFAMDTVKEERWQRDRAAFEAHCKVLNVDCVITVANNDSSRQINDVDNLLTQGVDALVIAPHDATQAASMVEKAKAQGVPVVPYDRLINSAKIDVYV